MAMNKVIAITSDTLHGAADKWTGFSIRESAGTPAVATVNFRQGSVSGTILGTAELAATESASLYLETPIAAQDGVYVQVVTGTITGSLFYR
jgi:hypothetical protein